MKICEISLRTTGFFRDLKDLSPNKRMLPKSSISIDRLAQRYTCSPTFIKRQADELYILFPGGNSMKNRDIFKLPDKSGKSKFAGYF